MNTYKKWQNKTPKTTIIVERVKRTILSIIPGADIVLYGSRARGSAESTSDWDFLVLVDDTVSRDLVTRIRNSLYDIELDSDSVLSAIVRKKKEWVSGTLAGIPFKNEVERDGVIL